MSIKWNEFKSSTGNSSSAALLASELYVKQAIKFTKKKKSTKH